MKIEINQECANGIAAFYKFMLEENNFYGILSSFRFLEL
jgi:hypothetical protein